MSVGILLLTSCRVLLLNADFTHSIVTSRSSGEVVPVGAITPMFFVVPVLTGAELKLCFRLVFVEAL